MSPAGTGRDLAERLVDRPGKQSWIDRCADEQLQRVDVLRDGGALAGDVCLRHCEDLLGLVEVGARRDPALEAELVS